MPTLATAIELTTPRKPQASTRRKWRCSLILTELAIAMTFCLTTIPSEVV